MPQFRFRREHEVIERNIPRITYDEDVRAKFHFPIAERSQLPREDFDDRTAHLIPVLLGVRRFWNAHGYTPAPLVGAENLIQRATGLFKKAFDVPLDSHALREEIDEIHASPFDELAERLKAQVKAGGIDYGDGQGGLRNGCPQRVGCVVRVARIEGHIGAKTSQCYTPLKCIERRGIMVHEVIAREGMRHSERQERASISFAGVVIE